MSSDREATKALDAKLASLDYDSHIDMYKDRAKQLAAQSQGLERLFYGLFETDVMASVVYAMDPFQKIEHTNQKIVPVNRRRSLPGIPLTKRTCYHRNVHHERSEIQGSGIWAPETGDTTDEYVAVDFSEPLGDQGAIPGFLNDTSRKTRPKDQNLGEFELYAPSLISPAVDYSRAENHSTITFSIPGLSNQQTYYEQNDFGYSAPAITISPSSHNIWYGHFQDWVSQTLNDNAMGLYAKALPTRRTFQVAYDIDQLRKSPALLRESVMFFRDIWGHVRDIHSLGDLYLAYKFGWELTLKGIMDMIRLPSIVNNDVNRIIARAGKPTTYRSSMKISTSMSSVPSMSEDIINIFDEYFGSTSSQSPVVISGSLRCALNCTYPMPNVDIPDTERLQLFLRKFGAELTNPVDVYNLIPWTWFIDWFGGYGDYLRAIEGILYDPSLINWGTLSLKVKGETTYSFVGHKTDYSSSTTEPPLTKSDETNELYSRRSGTFRFRYNKRVDLGSVISGLKTTSPDNSNLSSYQKSILAALAAKYSRV